ncbi:hypothetical protein CSUB8523_0811 [Campylobacter subantarcticus LMG 24377]|uniref:Tetratricopeptide repeat protein n=1 Tax=Campylobacter subantarcticus TaxID=497724 RepID=A0ABW9N5Q3_9BACT|nr:hypothetical protein [Campylobacter subantarcticus]AJC92334.1 hypothetical protein CSUB8523_0811 [Campylobacter subantarcticus LMG 24377]EAL3938557.1 hypothetical protein [Campylobacter lari]MPB99608.1 hypothetical protein [Campylobacter subantarcticus]
MLDKILYYYFNENYRKCLEYSEAYLNQDLKNALEYAMISSFKLGDFTNALHYARQIFNLYPTSFYGLMYAKALLSNRYFEDGVKLLQELLKRKDDLFDELSLELAYAYQSIGNLVEAEKLYQVALEKDLYNLDLWKSYAELYFKSNFTKALQAHEELCKFAQVMIEKLQNGELVEKNHIHSANLQDRLQKKTQENLTIVKINEYLNTQILPQKAYLLFKLLRLEESLNLFACLCEFNQNNAQFWQNYAKALELSSNYQGAYNAYQKALSLHSHATYQFDLAYLLMRMGESDNFEEGKRIYESRLFYAHNETFSPYHYNKTIQAFNKEGVQAFKDKTILVFCEQGFGDTIMYARCLEKLCQIASKVLFAPQSAMYEMFKNQIKEINKNSKAFLNLKVLKDFPKDFDYAMPICSLPLLCDIKLDEIPRLKTPLISLEKPSNIKKKIGIFWFTPNAAHSDLLRNVELEFLLNALKDLDCEIVSFQVENVGYFNLPDIVENRGEGLKNWEDTLNHLKDIDCVVSIDSAIAHLALALDIPTTVLLAPRFDWRWGKFENPKSYFWSKANLLTFNNEEDTKKRLQKWIKKQFNV